MSFIGLTILSVPLNHSAAALAYIVEFQHVRSVRGWFPFYLHRLPWKLEHPQNVIGLTAFVIESGRSKNGSIRVFVTYQIEF
jgi:hypothetical protein